MLPNHAHGIWDSNPVWAGIRRTDEDSSAAGIYSYFENREGKTSLQFRPIVADLSHEEAEITAGYLKERLQEEARTIQKDR